MSVLVMIAQILLGLSILVILHEWGHYAAARAFGIKVEKFFLFFDAWGVKLFSIKKGDTEYGVGWLPLGGYVKIAGMIDESMDKEFLNSEPKSWEFRSKPAWQRLIVMIGGVTVNAILGVIIFTGMTLFYGERYLPMEEVRYGVYPGPVGQEMGIQKGDQIVKVDGEKVTRFEQVLSPELAYSDNAKITVRRDGQTKTLSLPDNFLGQISDKGFSAFVQPMRPFSIERVIKGSGAAKAELQPGDEILAIGDEEVRFFHEARKALKKYSGQEVRIKIERNDQVMEKTVQVSDQGTLGFYPEFKLAYATETFGLAASLQKGTKRAWDGLATTVVGLGKVFTGDVDASKSVSGPIGIANMYGGTWNWPRFWGLTGLLSMVLAFMNMLPIPALDGGHVLFLLIEMIQGKPVSERVMGIAQTIGVVILISLMIFATSNDISNFIFDS